MRVSFPPGNQRQFVENTKLRSGLAWRAYRKSLGITNHTHYRYEDCTLPLRVFRKAIKIAGMSATEAKRFNYVLRKEPQEQTLKLRKDAALAEFLGICLGDGNLEPHWLAIFGDKANDTIYLKCHVAPLIRRTLKLNPKFKANRPDENFLVLNSTAAVRALHQLGLPIGDKIKNGARIPKWIRARRRLLEACLRGLFDTDGCVYGFCRRPPARGRKAIISFEFGVGSRLTGDVHRALCRLGYSPRMMPHRNESRLAVNSDIVSFMNRIKPSNSKHWDNFRRWYGPVV